MMLAKTLEKGGKDWDKHLPLVLFTYQASQQQSTQEFHFYLLYVRDHRFANRFCSLSFED